MVRVSAVGNIGQAKERSFVNKKGVQTKVLDVSLGCRRGKDATTWLKFSLFGEFAEKMKPYLVVGKPLFVTGELAAGAYIDKSGNPQPDTELRNVEFEFIGGGGKNAAKPATASDDFVEASDDDVVEFV